MSNQLSKMKFGQILLQFMANILESFLVSSEDRKLLSPYKAISNYSFIITRLHINFFLNNTTFQLIICHCIKKKKAKLFFKKVVTCNTQKKNSLTYISTSQYQNFFAYVFYLSTYHFKFVSSL